MEVIKLIGAIAGGLGLFLLAIGMMTDGLKLAAGSSLRKLLSKWSKTPLRGIFSGFFMTAIVQSSSAVTVASLGFVNAGLINMRQSLGIIYGANIGTTMTGWLVALIGFKLNIPAFSLSMIGVGMLMKLVKKQGKTASFGIALVGFGLFFLGIDVLKNAFETIVSSFDINEITTDTTLGIVKFLLAGIVMTILTQSSSASIALTITAASSGMVGIYAAAAMVIGANIGTTSTAILASIGATSNTKRVASAQVIFNVATAIVALLILPVLFFLIDRFTEFFNLNTNPAISLALFHTVFNILGVLLIFPLNDRLSIFLEKKFRTWEEMESHTKFLDKTIAQTPVLAVNALVLETLSVSDKVLSLYSCSIQPDRNSKHIIEKEATIIKKLSRDISKFIVNINSAASGSETSNYLATLMRIDQYFLSCALSIERLSHQLRKREKFEDLSLENTMQLYFEQIEYFMKQSRNWTAERTDLYSEQLPRLQSEHDKLKENLIVNGTRSIISVTQMSEAIDCLAETILLVQQWYKAFIRLQNIQNKLDSKSGVVFIAE